MARISQLEKAHFLASERRGRSRNMGAWRSKVGRATGFGCSQLLGWKWANAALRESLRFSVP